MSIKHTQKPDKPVFMDEKEIDEALKAMEKDAQLATNPVLVKNGEAFLKLVSFSDVHKHYLKTHPKVNPGNYLANLHAMIKIRS